MITPRNQWLDRNKDKSAQLIRDAILDFSSSKIVDSQPNRWQSSDNSSDRTNIFFIGATSRTGSNLLVRLLNKHPDIYCTHEVFPVHRIIEGCTASTFFFANWLISVGDNITLHPDAIAEMVYIWMSKEQPNKS